ncbi:MAG: ABC transporter ATP-binding protein [Microbacteriaceae bacterium]|nr:ABC transporter ATP-binding protein [Microbacteriaceae bacterium]
MPQSQQPVFSVQDLRVTIGAKEIVHGVSFDVFRGHTVGIVGESGSGKSVSVLSATRLLDLPHQRVTGSVHLSGNDLLTASKHELRRVHGRRVGFVFQDPSTSLNPLLTLERQLTEGPKQHLKLSHAAARERAIELLEAVGLPDPERRLSSYPHQLSGGQRQRVMIAVALACDPDVLIADEPTTALDVTTQAQIVELVQRLQAERGMGVVWISHDLGLIGQVADDVTVLLSGEAVEQKPVVEIFDAPEHAYTKRLLASRPSLERPGPDPAPVSDEPLLTVNDLSVSFQVPTPTGPSWVHAVTDVSFDMYRGETLGLVGESGSGKSTIAGALTGQVKPQQGELCLGGEDLLAARGATRKALRRKLAMVFQDPFSALNPRMRVRDAIAEPIIVHRLASSARERDQRVIELLEQVNVTAEFADRYPHEMSGGQRQRVCIARALACEPEVLILDESTASLDVSIQAEVMTLLKRLQIELGLTYLFIAHDLAVVHEMSHRVMVMKSGEIVESGDSRDLYQDPKQAYTKSLLDAIPPEKPVAARAAIH